MNNPVRSAMIICGDGMRPERDDPKTYQQNPPQPTASSRLRYSPSPIHHLRLFIAIFRLSLFPLFAMFPPSSPIISSPLVPTHSLPFSPTLPSLSHVPSVLSHHFTPTRPYTFPSLFTHPSLFVVILLLPSMPHSASFHPPSSILSFPFPHPFIPLPASSHSPSRILLFPFPLRPPSSPKQRPTNTIITTKVKNGS